jgi:hypothetical protein
MKLKIPIFAHNEETTQFEQIGMKYPLSDSKQIDVAFYQISFVGEYTDIDGTRYATIGSGPHEFISPLDQKRVEELIDEEAHKSIS